MINFLKVLKNAYNKQERPLKLFLKVSYSSKIEEITLPTSQQITQLPQEKEMLARGKRFLEDSKDIQTNKKQKI